MIRLDITASVNSDNETSFSIVDTEGNPVDLNAKGATKVTVKVCSRVGPPAEISSATGDVSFSGNTVLVKFGKLKLMGVHYPTIFYTTPTEPKEVIVAQGFETEIKLKGVC